MRNDTKRKVIRYIVITVIVNLLAPLLVYHLMVYKYSSFLSLLIATSIPLFDNLYHIIRDKKMDAFGLLMLAGFILSLIALLLGGDEKIILMRESFVTGIMGLIFIGSLFLSKPIIYYVALRFTLNEKEKSKKVFEQNWEIPYGRFVFRLITAVWGFSLVGEAVVRLLFLTRLSVSSFLVVSQLLFYFIIGGTIIWTIFYRRYAKNKLDQIKN